MKKAKNKFVCGDKSYNSIDDMLKDWEKQEKERLKKLSPEQRKQKKEKKTLTKKLERVKEKKRQEKYRKQRAYNGFCDEDIWSIDYWFVRIVPKMLRKLADIMHGYQPKLGYYYNTKTKEIEKTKREITFKEHKQVILKLADMIESIIVSDPEDKRWNNKKLGYMGDFNIKLKDRSLTIFRDIFFCLWD